jgi:phospholipid/cholesterol/gamma-HCH transport system permease protein
MLGAAKATKFFGLYYLGYIASLALRMNSFRLVIYSPKTFFCVLYTYHTYKTIINDIYPMNTTRFLAPLRAIGQITNDVVCALGYGLKAGVNWGHVVAQTASIGTGSVWMVMVINGIAGSVLALQTADKFLQAGTESYIGGLVSMAVIREIAPVFTGLAVGARAGTAIAAELANFRMNDQLAALGLFKVAPLRYLLLPRLLACLISMPLLTVIGSVVAHLGGMAMAFSVAHLYPQKFLESVWLTVGPYDIGVSLFKALLFGALIAGIASAIGLGSVRHSGLKGAKGVGHATTQAAVWTSVAIIVSDFILSWVFFVAN